MKNFEDVNGQCWVTYQGRQQGPMMYAQDYPEADKMCIETVERIKSECGEVFYLIYPDKSAWKFHMDGI